MADMMTKKLFLDVCIGIEGLCSEIYEYYSQIFEEYPDAVQLWKQTALEEENHQRQFELASRLIEEAEFEISNDSLKRAHSIHQKLHKLLNHIKENRPDQLTAVTKAIEMEEHLADLHAHTALKFREESMQSLFKAFSEADRDHVADLQRYRTILLLPDCGMGEEQFSA